MKPPKTPMAFRTSVKHYHRLSNRDSRNWDSWVGDKRRTGVIVFKTVLVLLGIAVVTGTWMLLK